MVYQEKLTQRFGEFERTKQALASSPYFNPDDYVNEDAWARDVATYAQALVRWRMSTNDQ